MENGKTLLFFGLVETNKLEVGRHEIPNIGDVINIINIPSPIKLDGAYVVKDVSEKQLNGKNYPRIHVMAISEDIDSSNPVFDFSRIER